MRWRCTRPSPSRATRRFAHFFVRTRGAPETMVRKVDETLAGSGRGGRGGNPHHGRDLRGGVAAEPCGRRDSGIDGAVRIAAGFHRTLWSLAVFHPAADSRDRHSRRAGRHAGRRSGDGRGPEPQAGDGRGWRSASRWPRSRCARYPCSWSRRCARPIR